MGNIYDCRKYCSGGYVLTRRDAPGVEVEIIRRDKEDGCYRDGWQAIGLWSPKDTYTDLLWTKRDAVFNGKAMLDRRIQERLEWANRAASRQR